MGKILFNYVGVSSSSVKDKRAIKRSIGKIFEMEGKALLRLNYIFCTDKYLLQINKSFLMHNDYTDIITFDLSQAYEIIGEIYISIERVKENSTIYKTKFHEELRRVIYHGALHLIGYKDKKKSEITMMRRKEDYYLRLLSPN